MIAQQDVRRRPDGSIDIEFYRDHGLMARRAVMAGFLRSAGKPLAAALMLVALYAVLPREGAPGVNAAAAATGITR